MPLHGVTLAFKKYNFSAGIAGSEWIGIKNFLSIFRKHDFWRAFWNTIIIAGYRLVFEFPVPIILAIAINEVNKKFVRRSIQVIFTFPHFLSWIVISGMIINLFGESGVVNKMLLSMGMEEVSFLSDPKHFRFFLTCTNNWKEAGWGTILYLAALSSVDPCLYEACSIDGGNRYHKIRYVDLPAIVPTAIILFILFIGNTLSSGTAGFNQIFNLYNEAVFSTGDILDTYIYRQSFYIGRPLGEMTAVGLFKSVINFGLIFGANKVVHKISNGEKGLF